MPILRVADMEAIKGRKLGVPLVQLDPVKPDEATREAMEDWRYWRAMAYEF